MIYILKIREIRKIINIRFMKLNRLEISDSSYFIQ